MSCGFFPIFASFQTFKIEETFDQIFEVPPNENDLDCNLILIFLLNTFKIMFIKISPQLLIYFFYFIFIINFYTRTRPT